MSDYADHIEDFVARNGAPNVVSIAPDTHIFHFEDDGCWDDGELVLVNKDGHYFRCRKHRGGWQFIKTWNNLHQVESWQSDGLTRYSLTELIGLCGTGPQNPKVPYETLCLLPKGSTLRGRKAVYRDHIMDVRFDVDNDKFTLFSPEGNETFSGKLWLSTDAVAWAKKVFTPKPVVVSEAEEEQQVELEDAGLWGMFS